MKSIDRPKNNIFSKSRPHNGPQPNPQRRKWPQMDSLVMNFSSKSTIFIVFYNVSGNFSWKPTFHFTPYKYCLQRTLCSDFRNQLLFLFYENKHFLKKLVSYLTPGQATKTKMTANGFSSYEVFVKLGTFQFTLRLKVSMFVKQVLFHFRPLKDCL